VTIAEEVSASFLRTYGYPEAALIPNAIDVERYSRPQVTRREWREQNGIELDAFAYLCVARFSEQKDHATLLRAFAHGPAQLANARLLLAGDGELRAQTEALARELKIESRVTFLGRRSDMPETLGAADAFALGSRWEGNPLSVMEAMAAGKPVVATSVGAIPELVRHGTDGLLSAAGDVDGLAQSMVRIRIDRAAAVMGRSAAARARERFGLPAMARAYSALYHRVAPVGRPRGGAAATPIARRLS
jgi:glycosyltransferase involved in cell wall biosynthesis